MSIMETVNQIPIEFARPAAAVTLTDEEIVARVCAGERELFELLMHRHNSRVYHAARAILHDGGETEDVMQDAYLRAYEHLRDFEGRARFSTWLTRIAVNEALARVRQKKRLDSLDSCTEEQSIFTTPASSPEQQTSDAEMRGLLEKAVGVLPEALRAVFVLRAIEGMSGAEVAERLNISKETVKTRMFRARRRLQKMLVESTEPALPSMYDFHVSRSDRVVATRLGRRRDRCGGALTGARENRVSRALRFAWQQAGSSGHSLGRRSIPWSRSSARTNPPLLATAIGC
jgi:RNA polymerase sigma-70 factor (ECF subfamily)